jgi:F0F1-type ATP synthase assembly protein I
VANGSDPDRASGTGDKDFDEVRQRLDALDAKLDAHRPDPVDERAAKQERTNYAMAVRVSSDFIAAILSVEPWVGSSILWQEHRRSG